MTKMQSFESQSFKYVRNIKTRSVDNRTQIKLFNLRLQPFLLDQPGSQFFVVDYVSDHTTLSFVLTALVSPWLLPALVSLLFQLVSSPNQTTPL